MAARRWRQQIACRGAAIGVFLAAGSESATRRSL